MKKRIINLKTAYSKFPRTFSKNTIFIMDSYEIVNTFYNYFPSIVESDQGKDQILT